MLGGAIVAAAVVTVLLAPPTLISWVVTFGFMALATVSLSYVVGLLGTPQKGSATAEVSTTPSEPPSKATQADIEAFRWAIQEGIGVAIASLFGLLLLILFLFERTEWITAREYTIGEFSEWFLLAVLAIALIALALWRWRGR
jgi:ABC-type branched-subunit amino acid transport system permease subunit